MKDRLAQAAQSIEAMQSEERGLERCRDDGINTLMQQTSACSFNPSWAFAPKQNAEHYVTS